MDHRRDVAELRINLHGRYFLPDLALTCLRATIGGAGVVLTGILDALHESRRRQSEREIARHRHLIASIKARAGEGI